METELEKSSHVGLFVIKNPTFIISNVYNLLVLNMVSYIRWVDEFPVNLYPFSMLVLWVFMLFVVKFLAVCASPFGNFRK